MVAKMHFIFSSCSNRGERYPAPDEVKTKINRKVVPSGIFVNTRGCFP